MIRVSVIIPTFNSERKIGNTLRSLYSQEGIGRYFELETLVVDDCSTDQTLSVVRQFPISFLHVNTTNSGGPNKGKNIALRAATGDYICLLDHDDLWAPTKLLYQLEAIHQAPIVTCLYQQNMSFEFQSVFAQPRVTLFDANETFCMKLARRWKNVQCTYTSTLMFHASLKHHLFEEHFGVVDYDWFLRLAKGQKSVQVEIPLVSRGVDGLNLSLNKEYRRKDYYFSLMTLELYENEFPAQVAIARKRLTRSRARYYYKIGDMKEARKYFLKERPGYKELLYYITTYFGSRWVRKNFTVFG